MTHQALFKNIVNTMIHFVILHLPDCTGVSLQTLYIAYFYLFWYFFNQEVTGKYCVNYVCVIDIFNNLMSKWKCADLLFWQFWSSILSCTTNQEPYKDVSVAVRKISVLFSHCANNCRTIKSNGSIKSHSKCLLISGRHFKRKELP